MDLRAESRTPGAALKLTILLVSLALCSTTARAQCENSDDARLFRFENLPSVMEPGESRTITIFMENTGSPGGDCPTLWRPEYGYRLGSVNPPLNTTWGDSSHLIATSTTTEGERVQRFPVTITAPAVPGDYTLQYRMVQIGNLRNCFACGGCETVPSNEPHFWFGERTPAVTIKVRSSGIFRYVALGDSYSAGEGVDPWLPGTIADDAHCSRSTRAYSRLLPISGEANRVFEACSMAKIENFYHERQSFPDGLANPLQAIHLGGSDFVTLTIGGNNIRVSPDPAEDRGFTRVLKDCAVTECTENTDYWNTYWTNIFRYLRGQWPFSGRRPADNAEMGLPAELSALFEQIRKDVGPDTPVAILGYHRMFADTLEEQQCSAVSGFYSPAEQQRVREAARILNETIKTEAEGKGFIFVDVQKAFVDHLICDGAVGDWRDSTNEWVNFVSNPNRLQPVGDESFHPTACGQNAYAAALRATILDPNDDSELEMPDCRAGTYYQIRDALVDVLGLNKRARQIGDIVHGGKKIIDWIGRAADNILLEPAEGAVLSSGEITPLNVGSANTDRDGKPDLIWRHKSANGYNALWGMDGTQRVASVSIRQVANVDWKIAGQADFDGDGQTDILWRNYATGANHVWVMHGPEYVTSIVLPAVTNVDWEIGSVADFDRDGHADILWHHPNGTNVVWKMSGTSYVSYYSLPSSGTDSGWRIVGSGDFNSDGHTDVLWQHSNGLIVFWLMNRTSVTEQIATVEFDLPLNMRLGAIVDLDQDGHLDLIIRDIRSNHGDIYVLYLNQTEIRTWDRIGRITDLDWEIVGPR